ncbi:MerR family transcriptional regulator [Rhodococcus sp. BGS-1C]|uniref:MerR family transcriptional regulator n=1 Tax=unclassified Rhodococcus (in: high G+C Gram-positive bacteria) TaxID=192944 RepID=UPI0019D17FE9|nr:MerR family transcriptional regulator [Rhodococcus sp. KRD197]
MRPVDLARGHALSTQAIRNYEDAGVLPPAARSESGYRSYTPVHAQALRTFLALRRGHGYQRSVEILRAVNRGDTDAGYRLIDLAHVELHTERARRAESAAALGGLTVTAIRSAAGQSLTVGELGRRLGMHAATLRTWESAGIVHPRRDRVTGYRMYDAECVRDAEVARQLRRGGYPLRRIAQFVSSLREAGGAAVLAVFLDEWQDRLSARSRNLLNGAAQLDAYLGLLEDYRSCRS